MSFQVQRFHRLLLMLFVSLYLMLLTINEDARLFLFKVKDYCMKMFENNIKNSFINCRVRAIAIQN